MSGTTATVVLAVDSRQAEANLQRFKQESEKAAAAVKPLENPITAKFDSAQAVSGMKNLSVEAQGTYETLMKISQAAAAIFAGSKLVGFFSSSIKEASASREDFTQFQHIFRNVRNEAEAMVKTLQGDAFGRTSREAMQLTMNLGSLLKGIGLTDRAAVDLTTEFAKMAVDIGSFVAKDPRDVMSAMESALMGNTMALRTYGVFLTDVGLKEKMAQQAKEGLVFATEREARAYAILSETQRQQSDAIGDFSVESQNYRNQVDQLSKGLKTLKANVGEALIEPATKVVQSLNSMVDWLKTLDQTTVTFITRTAAVGAGLATAGMAYRTISPLVRSLATVTGLSSKAINVETASLRANTMALSANAGARKLASASRMIPNVSRLGGGALSSSPKLATRAVSDGRWRAAEYAFMDRVTRGGSFGITGGPIDFSQASRPDRMASGAARAFERSTGLERTRALSSSRVSTALNTVALERSVSRLSFGFKGLEGPASRLVSTTSRLTPLLGRVVSFAGPIGAVVGGVATISYAAKTLPMSMEKLIDKAPEYATALEGSIKTFFGETIPNGFESVGDWLYKWAGQTGYGLQQLLGRPFGETDTTGLYNSEKGVETMLNRETGRTLATGQKETMRDVMDRNNERWGKSAAEREAERLAARDELYKKLNGVLPSLQDDAKKAIGKSDAQYKIDNSSASTQLDYYSNRFNEADRQLKLFNSGNKDFILGLNKSGEELEKWAKDMQEQRDKFRTNRDAAQDKVWDERDKKLQTKASEEQKKFDRMTEDEQYSVLQGKLEKALAAQNRYQTASGKKNVQGEIDDLRYQMKPYEEKKLERSRQEREQYREIDELAFNSKLATLGRSDQEKLLRERLQETEARNDKRLASVKEGKNLSGDDYKMAVDDLQRSKDYVEQLKQIQPEQPKIPVFQQTAGEAVDSRSTTARIRESTVWGIGQSKTEKDIGEIRQLMKKLSETAKAIKNKSTTTLEFVTPSSFGY